MYNFGEGFAIFMAVTIVLVILSVPILLVLVLVKLSALKRELNESRQQRDRLEALPDYPISQQFVPPPFDPSQLAPQQPIPQQPIPQSAFQPAAQQFAPQQPVFSPQSAMSSQSGASQLATFPPPIPQQPISQPGIPQPAVSQPAAPQHVVPPSTTLPPPIPQQPISQQLTPLRPISQPVPQQSVAQTSLETLFGRNVIGIIASVLVFLGLVFLGFLVVPLFTDALKIIALFLLSAVLSGVGFILNRKYNNNFTKALLGTGCGAFFISIMLTHLWFHVFSDLVALALLLAWLILCFILTKATQSLLVAIITHVGMVISVSAACLVGVGDGKIMLVLAYQAAATVVILVGNILCYRKTYRFGLYASLALSLFASLIVWTDIFSQGTVFAGIMPSIPDAMYFLIQFIGSTALAYLLFVSSARVKRSATQAALQVLTMFLWLGALTFNVGVFIVWMMETGTALPFEQTSGLASVVLFALASIFVLLTVLLRRTLHFSRAMERVTICMVAGYLLLLCFWRFFGCWLADPYPYAFVELLYLVVPAALLVLIQRLTDDELYGYLAMIFLGIDALFMFGTGYGRLEEVAPIGLSFGYLVLMEFLFWLVYRGFSAERRSRCGAAIRLIMLLSFEVSLCAVAFHSTYASGFALALLLCAIMLGIAHFTKKDRPLWAYRVNEYVIVLFAFAVVFMPVGDIVRLAVHIALVLVCLVLMLERVRQVAIRSAADLREGRPVSNDIETLTALALFLLIVGVVNGLADWSQLPYVLSLACMAAALLVIALGFWSRARSLRLTGLVVLVICVLKLTIIDIGDVNSLMRVVAFIIGGVICFAISALYNFLVKLQEKNG
ncbi:MAG: DUF2339 domain-containing protein [Coriobacteriales bacterium]|jgi:hypothetical protein|nr:DUF2339 domain-containing protein [Coriobacteriales bacterium]